MEKERKIEAPDGCEIEKVEIVDGVAVVTFKQKERKLPKSWEEFCEMCEFKEGECFISTSSEVVEYRTEDLRGEKTDRNLLPDRATAEAILALMQLIELRNCYNGDWVPDWKDCDEIKYSILFEEEKIVIGDIIIFAESMLFFKTEKLRNEFLHNFHDLIEKLKPLHGIKEGGQNE